MEFYTLLEFLDPNLEIFIVTTYGPGKPGEIKTYYNGKVKDIPIKKIDYYSRGTIKKPITVTSYENYAELEIYILIDENEQF